MSVPSLGRGSTGEEIAVLAGDSTRVGAKGLLEMQGSVAWELLEMCEQMFKEGKIGRYILKRVKLGGD